MNPMVSTRAEGLRRPTLLVVDDQALNIQVLNQVFCTDHQVLMATTGEQAVRMCRSHLPDLVLLDVVMPGMDGHEVCRQLKADPATRDIPIVFVTAQDDPDMETLGLELGAADFIVKPVKPAVVRARVKTHLGFARATAQLQALNETLESRIRHRTGELEAAVQRADAASHAKSEFLSNMSHEIRTPLNGVIGMAHLALRAEPNDRQRHCLEQIQSSGRHLLEIVNDILDFSKIEAGKLELEETDFLLAELMDSLAGQTDVAARDKGLDLVFQIDPGLADRFHGDTLRIRQVLLNFIGNAIKFSTQGEVIVRALPQPGRPGQGLCFEVQDHGTGIPQAQAAGLFQAFHQADASTTRRYGGTGLGLAICRQLATLMDGEVGVRSEPGAGSTFWFCAPWPAVTGPAVASPGTPTYDVLRGARILVAEDNPVNQQVATDLLQDLGALVQVATNGEQAIEVLLAHSFDCVLMDMQMPVLDGLQATRRIKALPQLSMIPVVAVTANASEDDRARCLAAGMVDFISKPFDPAHLYATVARCLCAVQPAAAPVLDLAALSHNVAGNAQRMRRYAAMFNDSIALNLSELQAALARADLPGLADLGHRMKASARVVGATRFADQCQALEDLRDKGSLEQAATIVAALPALLAQVSACIEEEFV